jgi:hypothetical protein
VNVRLGRQIGLCRQGYPGRARLAAPGRARHAGLDSRDRREGVWREG